MRILVCAALSIFVGCTSTTENQEPHQSQRQTLLIIPMEEFKAISSDVNFTIDEARELERRYSAPASDRVFAQISQLDHEQYFVCGGVVWDGAVELESKMQMVGVTEAWVPINGTVTRVLHFQLKEQL